MSQPLPSFEAAPSFERVHGRILRLPAAALLAGLLVVGLPAAAQYKVVQPDGSVTYTDRPPVNPTARVTQLGRQGLLSAADQNQALPPELRKAVQRYPVTLYTSTDCGPCDSGRLLLQGRGVPYDERRIATADDAQTLERLTGSRTLPSISIGAQPVRGFSEPEWNSFLDAAGYPRDSKLPANWPATVATPLVQSTPVGAARPSQPATEVAPPVLPASGVRF